MKKTMLVLVVAAGMSNMAYAVTNNDSICGDAINCNLSDQTMGDTSSSADNSMSSATQSNPSSNSNASSGAITVDPNIQQSGNTVDQNAEQWTSSEANSSSSGNKTDVKTGNTSANSSNGDQSFNGQVGDSSANSSATTGNNRNDVSGTVTNGDQNFNGQVGDSTSSATTGNNRNDINGTVTGGDQSVSGQVGDSTSSATTGNNELANSQGQEQNAESSANSNQDQNAESNVDIDNSDNSSSSYSNKVDARSLYIPSIAAPVIPSTNPAANTTVIAGQCGPMFSLNREAVHGTFNGFFRTRLIEVGHEDFKAPYVDENGKVIRFEAYQRPDRGWNVYGHQAIYTVAVVNVSGSRHFGMGGGGGNAMNWAQGQGGGSSAMQRIVTNIQVEPCLAGEVPPPPVATTVKRIRQ